MTTNRKAELTVAGAGAVTIAAFFFPFLDLGGLIQASGWDVLTADGTALWTRLLLLGLPLGGLAMLVGGLSGKAGAKRAGVVFGLGVLGYLGFQVVRAFFATTGWGLWLTIGAAFVGLIAAAGIRK